MKRLVIVFILALGLSVVCLAQPVYNPDDNVKNAVFHSGNPCAMLDPVKLRSITGKVVKRNFDEDEITIQSFIIADAKDRRLKVSIEELFFEDQSILRDSLNDFLWVSRPVTVTYVVCKNFFYLHKVEPAVNSRRKS